MAKTATYTLIMSTVLNSNTPNVTLSSIPSTYTDLVLVCQTAQPSSTGELFIRVNSDTGNNYSYTSLTGDGLSAASNRVSNTSIIFGGHLSTNFGTYIFNFLDYSNTTTFKTILSRGNDASRVVSANVGLWRSTSAINSIFLGQANSGTNLFTSGSTFRLYGIEAGNL